MNDLRLEKLQTVKARNLQIAGGVNLNASGKGTLKKPELLATLEIPTLQVQKETIQGIKLQTHLQNQIADITLDSAVAQTYVKARGSVGIAAPYNANLRVDTGRIAFAPLLALYAPAQAPDAGGETELHVFVKGPLADKNKVEAHLEIPVLKANYKQLQLGAAKPIRVDYQNSVAVLQPTSIEGTGTSIRLQASVPVNNPNAAMVLAEAPWICESSWSHLIWKAKGRFDLTLIRDGMVQIRTSMGKSGWRMPVFVQWIRRLDWMTQMAFSPSPRSGWRSPVLRARWEEVRSPRKVESTTGLPCSLIWRWRPARCAFAIPKGCGRLWIRTSRLPEMPKLPPWVGW